MPVPIEPVPSHADLSPVMVRLVTERIKARGLDGRITARQADAQDLSDFDVRHPSAPCLMLHQHRNMHNLQTSLPSVRVRAQREGIEVPCSPALAGLASLSTGASTIHDLGDPSVRLAVATGTRHDRCRRR